VQEAIYAMAMEVRYSKDEILTIYLNRAYLGAGTRGFEAAAQRYFGKSANEVERRRGRDAGGLLIAPTRFAPHREPPAQRRTAPAHHRLMEEQGYLSPPRPPLRARTPRGCPRPPRRARAAISPTG
jgi:penicillin-binding protein 1A